MYFVSPKGTKAWPERVAGEISGFSELFNSEGELMEKL